jgi:hypothetical protein
MIAVITGDIIDSRKVAPTVWLPELKAYCESITASSSQWSIYRGDSFQLEVDAEEALNIAMTIKALIKSKPIINVRMAIGIGYKNYESNNIQEASGSAYINSGDAFEKLKNQVLAIKSPYLMLDQYFNPILRLISFVTDSWKPVTAQTIFFSLKHNNLLQKEIAQELAKDRTTINKALKRGAYPEISDILQLYHQMIQQCMHSS